MKFIAKTLRQFAFKLSPAQYGHLILIDRRTHEHLTAGWDQSRDRSGKIHLMVMAPEVDAFITGRGGKVIPNNLDGVSTFLEFAPSKWEQDLYMRHYISFPDAESAVEFKLRFL